jgi:uncharacterized protein YndB with AHSA1/START domain
MILELESSRRELRASMLRANQADTDVRISMTIQAEWGRILTALTVPEFMDTWLTMPGTERLECLPERNSPGNFRIDIFSGETYAKSIRVSCTRTKPDEISYLWDKASNENTAKSLVKMRLRGGPRRCSLHLTHHGLWGYEEYKWYSTMWQKSLDKLRGVMERKPLRLSMMR